MASPGWPPHKYLRLAVVLGGHNSQYRPYRDIQIIMIIIIIIIAKQY